MSLSSWDTLAVDENGNSTNGVFESFQDVKVEIYKNWLHIIDKKAWAKNCGYTKNVIAVINEGDLSYKDVNIIAIQGPQKGIYCVVWSQKYEEGSNKKPELRGMVGCGVNGYKGEKWVGVSSKSLEWFRKKLTDKVKFTCTYTTYIHGNKEKVKVEKGKHTSLTYKLDIPDELRFVNLTKALRFNQGDAFFAINVRKAIPATPTGSVNVPIIEKLLK